VPVGRVGDVLLLFVIVTVLGELPLIVVVLEDTGEELVLGGLEIGIDVVVVLEDIGEELALSGLEIGGIDIVVLLPGTVPLYGAVPLVGAPPDQKPFHTAIEQFADCTPLTDASNEQLPAS